MYRKSMVDEKRLTCDALRFLKGKLLGLLEKMEVERRRYLN